MLRHNAVRNVVCSAVAEFTSVSPELEKPGFLLPPRPPDPGGTHPDVDPSFVSPSPPAAGRRPADIWVPRSVSGFAEAWDFLVSSLLRSSHLSSASPSVADVFHEVETRKRAFQDTASLVAEREATFCPLVLEACGSGWSQAFRSVVAWIASQSRTARGLATDSPKDTSLRIAQRISCTLHRENVRAILRRSPAKSPPLVGDLGVSFFSFPFVVWCGEFVCLTVLFAALGCRSVGCCLFHFEDRFCRGVSVPVPVFVPFASA